MWWMSFFTHGVVENVALTAQQNCIKLDGTREGFGTVVESDFSSRNRNFGVHSSEFPSAKFDFLGALCSI